MTETEEISGEKMLQGTLVRGIGSFYYVKTAEGVEYTLRCKKKFRHLHLTPLPGDEVLFTPGSGAQHGWLEEILPRRSLCLRPPVANVTRLVIVVAPVPEADLVLTDRQIERAFAQQVEVVLAVNKLDLDESLYPRLQAEYGKSGVKLVPVSAKRGDGLKELKQAMQGALCCMTGQSGAGKSTLLNALLGLELETGEISQKIERGKNTTRHAELIEKDGLRVMDTAGFSLLEPEQNLEPEKLRERIPEFQPYEGKCRFHECLHDREPGCAVAQAAAEGLISQGRLDRYRLLLSETRQAWKDRFQ